MKMVCREERRGSISPGITMSVLMQKGEGERDTETERQRETDLWSSIRVSELGKCVIFLGSP